MLKSNAKCDKLLPVLLFGLHPDRQDVQKDNGNLFTPVGIPTCLQSETGPISSVVYWQSEAFTLLLLTAINCLPTTHRVAYFRCTITQIKSRFGHQNVPVCEQFIYSGSEPKNSGTHRSMNTFLPVVGSINTWPCSLSKGEFNHHFCLLMAENCLSIHCDLL